MLLYYVHASSKTYAFRQILQCTTNTIHQLIYFLDSWTSRSSTGPIGTGHSSRHTTWHSSRHTTRHSSRHTSTTGLLIQLSYDWIAHPFNCLLLILKFILLQPTDWNRA